ncbi:MAG TPA: ABC transporter ATP-binding protein [Thermoanaerobacter sp.]|nr:ABC transporter ATP-binding protein [Thermoanaerobacter sp.]
MNEIIYCENLKKVYKSKSGAIEALKNITVKVFKGEFIGLIGPNGAGKTTFIKIITGLLLPTQYSKLTVMGFNPVDNDNEFKKKIGLVLDTSQLYFNLTAYENLEFFCRLYGMKNYREKIYDILKKVGLFDRRHQLVGEFSNGMKQRLNIARALVTNAELLILDEPTNGLDPVAVGEIHELLNEINSNGMTIIMTTHNMNEVEELCNRVILINNGEIVAEGSPNKLKESITPNIYKIMINEDLKLFKEKLEKIGVKKYIVRKEEGKNKVIIFEENEKVLELAKYEEFEKHSIKLEDVFLYYVERVGNGKY